MATWGCDEGVSHILAEWSLNSLPVLEVLAMLEAEGVKDKIYSSSGTPSPCPDSLIDLKIIFSTRGSYSLNLLRQH